jgi:putative inorganic carbon (HCO3(-)) transporter
MLIENVARAPVSLDSPVNPRAHYDKVLFWVTFGSAVSIVFSIAISQILLGVGLLLAILARRPVNFPPIKLPLALFFALTVLADLVSGHPLAGLPQIRKFFVFGIVVLISTAFQGLTQVRNLFLTWVGVGVLSAIDGFAQVLSRRQEAIRQNWSSYGFYLDDRITGFASHWMTFGAEQMIIFLILLSYLLFACPRSWRPLGWCCACCLWISLMLGLTRSIFLLGVPVGAVYLLSVCRPWTLGLLPLVALVCWAAVPFQVRERIESAISPHGEMDSNAQRYVSRRTGWEMVKAHPWIGLGPEQIKPQFEAYVPPDIPRPLPRGWYGHLHNIYLQYAAERGVPALLCLLWMIGKMLLDFSAVIRKGSVARQHQWVLHGAIAVIAAILAEGFFEHNLGDSEVLTMFLVVTASAYTVIGKEGVVCASR